MTSIDYPTEVYCSHCGEKHAKTECKLIPNWGYKCPECGGKCRTKPKAWKNYYKLNYVPQHGKPNQYVREIKELAKAKTRVE